MREKSQKQLTLMNPAVDHPQARELESISWILDQEADIVDMVHQDLCQGRPKATGACGMSAEQVLRAAIVKRMFGLSYELLLPFHLADSNSLQRFCRIGIAGRRFKKSALAKNIKRISPQAWERINRILTVLGKEENIKRGSIVLSTGRHANASKIFLTLKPTSNNKVFM